jgi:hypothetical protein
MTKKLVLVFVLLFTFNISMAPSVFAQTSNNPLSKACEEIPVNDERRKESAACSGVKYKRDKNGNIIKDKDGNPIVDNPLFGGDGLLNKITRGVAVVAGSIAVIFMIIGGYKMILSNSDKQAFTNGRNTLIYAAVGLVVITIAQALISFIITRVT